jgi:adenylylsulfate kinase
MNVAPGFGVWISGLPASGKSTLALALARELEAAGLRTEILDSDALRRVITPNPTYGDDERDAFYGAMTHIGELLVRHGVAVIFAATANRRIHRERARHRIGRFIEVFTDCPLETCVSRDPKGIYRNALAGGTSTVPGVQRTYERPEHADVVVPSDRETPEAAARRVLEVLRARGCLSG